MLELEFAQASDCGRVRDHNEDYLGYVPPEVPEPGLSNGWLFALADKQMSQAMTAMHDDPARRWTLQAGAVLVGERQDPDPYVFGVNRNRGYQNVYASGSFRLNKHVSPFLHAANLLNQDYSEVLGYPALSRNVYGGLRLEW